jgi:toxin YoeB
VKLIWSGTSWDDYLHWQDTDHDVVRKINEIIKDARREPFKGIGKPEPLKGKLAGWWSRRITAEHRLVYRVAGKGEQQSLEIAQCRGHYDIR